MEGYCNGGHSNNSSHLNHYHFHKNYHNTSTATGALSSRSLVGGSSITESRSILYSEELRPQLIVAENEKIFVEEMVGDEVTIKERFYYNNIF